MRMHALDDCILSWSSLPAETLSWSKPKVSGDIPPPLRAHSAIAFDKRIFIFGGGEGPSYYNDLYYFDTGKLPLTFVMYLARPTQTPVS